MTRDYVEIVNLISRYAELLNLGRIDEVGALFRYGRITSATNPQVWEGTEQVIGMYRDTVVFGDKVPDTLIFTSNFQVEVDGDAASAKAYFLAMHESSHGLVPVLAGRYHDQFRRIDGTWWFHERRMFPDLRGDLSSHLTRPLEEIEREAADSA